VNRIGPDQINRDLGNWLREESSTRAPAGLVEEVFARTSRTRQARRWWPPVSPLRSRGAGPHLIGAEWAPAPWRGTALAGALGIVLVVVVLGLALRPGGTGPGTSAPPTASPSASPVVTSSPSPSSTSSAASASVPPTPVPTTLDGLPAQRLSLGVDAGPIAVIEAFGSIWVADIHADDVRRFEPATMRELARIPVSGAAWFAVADGALWVTNQTGTGLSRIDPATNTVVAHVGDVPPCAAPVVAFDSVWQAACDAAVYLQIDPVQNVVVKTIPAQSHGFMVLAAGQLIVVGPDGLARLDPETGAFTAIPNPAAVGYEFLASDGTTIWLKNSAGMARIDPADGRTIAGLPYPGARAISFAGDHAWLTVTGEGVLEIDLATNKVTRTIPLLPSPNIPVEAGGALWVTDFDNSDLWRIGL
jgi:DNA-binding beta-propeller fold protein YncE